MSSSDASASPNATLEDQLALALQREALEEVLSASRTYLTGLLSPQFFTPTFLNWRAACFAIYAWDFILTFPDEYRTMWRAERWTPVRVAFFINRYGILLDIIMFMCLFWLRIDPKTCDKVHILEPVAGSILFCAQPSFNSILEELTEVNMVAVSCEFLLGARVWVMWNKRKWVAWFFGIFAICGVVIQIWAVAPNKPLTLIPALFYDTTATILVLIPLISHWRESPRTRLLTIFARDGAIYFIVVFICNLVNAVYFSIPTVLNPALNAPLPLTFTPMMASRIVLQLRSVNPAENSRGAGTTNGSGSGRRTDVIPKLGSHRPDPRGEVEVRLQSWERRIEGDLPVSYAGAVFKVETMTNLQKDKEKGLEPPPDEYSQSDYSVQVVAKNP
ncbi:hypothetical protein BT69DRAFT_1356913 [Atractiella rhizophila]|nr:hypothetical protein BT69DRAFT_1356913 [Atractiella rhizophila]